MAGALDEDDCSANTVIAKPSQVCSAHARMSRALRSPLDCTPQQLPMIQMPKIRPSSGGQCIDNIFPEV